MTPSSQPEPPAAEKLGDLAASAGLHRIHMLSWRDLDDVEAGGSEVHAAEVARRWAEAGIDVTWRTSYAQGHPPEVRRDGYTVVRRAGRYLIFPRAAYSEMTGRHGGRDALVEIWNGMPFFSPLWARGPRVVVLHHVHADMWRMVLPENLARLGEFAELRLAPLVYRRSRIVTLSPSSREDIVELLRIPRANIDVVAPGVDHRFTPGGRRSQTPLVVAVGRLVPVKRYDLLIRAVADARRRVPDIELTITSDGYERHALDEVVDEVGGRDWVHFAGHVAVDDLVDLYRRAWMVASASAREGWGMALTEAAACGTPAVATRIPGHLDAIEDGVSGLLAPDPSDLGDLIARVAGDESLRSDLSAGAVRHAGRFDWDRTAEQILRCLVHQVHRSAP